MFTAKRLYFFTVSLALIVMLALGGCGSTGSDSTPDPDPDPNPDPSASFDSGTMGADGTFSYTFENEGDVEYFCQIHAPDMQGKITVTSDVETAERDTVLMENMEFVPAQLSVAPGTEVLWINESTLDHTVTSGNPSSGDGDY